VGPVRFVRFKLKVVMRNDGDTVDLEQLCNSTRLHAITLNETAVFRMYVTDFQLSCLYCQDFVMNGELSSP